MIIRWVMRVVFGMLIANFLKLLVRLISVIAS